MMKYLNIVLLNILILLKEEVWFLRWEVALAIGQAKAFHYLQLQKMK